MPNDHSTDTVIDLRKPVRELQHAYAPPPRERGIDAAIVVAVIATFTGTTAVLLIIVLRAPIGPLTYALLALALAWTGAMLVRLVRQRRADDGRNWWKRHRP